MNVGSLSYLYSCSALCVQIAFIFIVIENVRPSPCHHSLLSFTIHSIRLVMELVSVCACYFYGYLLYRDIKYKLFYTLRFHIHIDGLAENILYSLYPHPSIFTSAYTSKSTTTSTTSSCKFLGPHP